MKRWLKWVAALGAVTALTLAWPGITYDGNLAYAEKVAAKDNLHLLAQLVCGEARGEPFEGQVGVAAVILNRTFDRRFPNSVAGVVYQTHAFEAVSNGQIYAATSPQCYRAARAALSGWDPTHGSIYYFAPAKTNNRFIWSRPQVRTIGRHIFAR